MPRRIDDGLGSWGTINMTPNSILTTLLFALVIGAATKASANDGVTATRIASATKTCRADEDTLRVLRLTTFDGGVRVDYEFVVSGRASWTHMNRPLLKQFGIRAAGTFCLPKDTRVDDDTDYD